MNEKERVINSLQKNRKSYEESNGVSNKYLIAHVKNQLFSCYDGTLMSKLPSEEKRRLDIETLRFIITEVFQLFPEQLDSIWSNDVLVRMNISSLVRDIYDDSPEELKEATLFDKRLVILHECFPEYYRCTYPEHYDQMDVINASDTTLKNLCKAGRVDADRLTAQLSGDDPGKRRTPAGIGTSGEAVDRITYKALNTFLKTATGTEDINEHLIALSHPNTLKIKSLGVSKVIASRGCWKSLLDFYYLNSSRAVQTVCFETYKELRAETQDYDAISAFMDEIDFDER